MSEIPRKDFLLFPKQYEQEHYLSDFEDDAKLAAMRHLFPGKGPTPLEEALRGFELFIIRLGKDAESVLLGPTSMSQPFGKSIQDISAAQSSPRGKKRRVKDYTDHRQCQESLTGVGALKPPRARIRLLLWMQETKRG